MLPQFTYVCDFSRQCARTWGFAAHCTWLVVSSEIRRHSVALRWFFLIYCYRGFLLFSVGVKSSFFLHLLCA